MFSGIAGGLQVLSNEAVNYVVFDGSVSAGVVLNSYIGGVGSFLGPALGAALMTFFGYAASDATQSWLLYQGVLFVLVMMFNGARRTDRPAPSVGCATARLFGRHGAFAMWAASRCCRWWRRCWWVRAGSSSSRCCNAWCSQDYRALAQLSVGPKPITLFGHPWSPNAVSTWLLPLALLGAGAALMGVARWRLAAMAPSKNENGHE